MKNLKTPHSCKCSCRFLSFFLLVFMSVVTELLFVSAASATAAALGWVGWAAYTAAAQRRITATCDTRSGDKHGGRQMKIIGRKARMGRCFLGRETDASGRNISMQPSCWFSCRNEADTQEPATKTPQTSSYCSTYWHIWQHRQVAALQLHSRPWQQLCCNF